MAMQGLEQQQAFLALPPTCVSLLRWLQVLMDTWALALRSVARSSVDPYCQQWSPTPGLGKARWPNG
ncbi:rCG21766, isoform CRA_a [Rattus norvegicus]|uniref:RCG21766, isoform CRA_a n=1 Tax=Rattus norvegicus TaxID=10116 RepID=A6J252_RAT|nr:rCG21766, isoform CRA_a [Rattus norvegicus]EDM13992.1 rCG21766, isoform CRA_a [Rattus norvegicus]